VVVEVRNEPSLFLSDSVLAFWSLDDTLERACDLDELDDREATVGRNERCKLFVAIPTNEDFTGSATTLAIQMSTLAAVDIHITTSRLHQSLNLRT